MHQSITGPKVFPLRRLAAVFSVCLMTPAITACGGDDEASSNEQVTDGASGCYDPELHVCDCETDESNCEATEGVWTDECACE
ncbi:MAG TPA: hypothetical protein VFU02_21115 [Polyangiaceae bacterium]|nr:hypothetical protein [Polyangiaceae bacterium]